MFDERHHLTSARCASCGGSEFIASKFRTNASNRPQCAQCGSLERHRMVRSLYEKITPMLKRWRALQFAPDQSTNPSWFAEFRGSTYGTSDGLDMMDTKLPDAAFDIVISNHVLEHVSDDGQALREMIRLVGGAGIVQVTIPSPVWRWETLDWGFADPDKNWHYRDYGADFPSYALRHLGECQCLSASVCDPVTGLADVVYFFSRTPDRLADMAAIWQRIPIALVRHC